MIKKEMNKETLQKIIDEILKMLSGEGEYEYTKALGIVLKYEKWIKEDK